MQLKDMKDWQRKKLLTNFFLYIVVAMIFLAYTLTSLQNDKKAEDDAWEASFMSEEQYREIIGDIDKNATKVSTGTYVENLKEVNIKGSFYRVVFLTWFRWDGNEDIDMSDHFRVYKGYMNKMEVVKDFHENGQNYQLLRCDVTVTKNYWTKRFPLESHQLRFYIESEYPANQVVLVNDTENSGLNVNLSLGGYNMRRHGTGIMAMEYDGTHGDPELKENVITTEHMTAMEINRDSWGLYVKCFIALVGTITWVLITLYINTYHKVDPLGMIPAALFGTVTNIMVGANLLPDALDLGLLEYTNFWGIFTILAVAITIININRIRNKYEDRDFATYLGRLMFFTILFFVIAGNVLLPATAYIF